MTNAVVSQRNHHPTALDTTSSSRWQRLRRELCWDALALGLCLGSLWLLSPPRYIQPQPHTATSPASAMVAHQSPSIHTSSKALNH